MARIIVTGGAGFIGSHLVDRLIEEKHKVIVVDNLSTGRQEFVNPKAQFEYYDLTQRNLFDSLLELFQGAQYVFHEAALPRIQLSMTDPMETFYANVAATEQVLELARQAKVKRVVYASSSSVYGNQDKLPITEAAWGRPISPYAMHKYLSELLCLNYSQNFGLDTVCLRYFNVYGARASTTGAYKLVMAIFKEQKEKGKPLTIYGDGTQTRDFTYIDDVVDANLAAMKYEGKFVGSAFNICSGEEVSINDIASEFGGRVEHIENPRAFEEKRKVGSYELAKHFLGYSPKVKVKEGIKLML